MRTWFANPIVQFILTVFLSVGGYIVAYNIFFLERETRSVQVIILSNSSILNESLEILQDMEISYKGNDIDNLSLIQVRLENNGNQPLEVSDFAEPIRFIFPESSRILEAIILDTEPNGINIPLETLDNVTTLSPALMNPGDRLILRFAVTYTGTTDIGSMFEVSARIRGVSQISTTTALELPLNNSPRNIVSDIAGIIAALVSTFVLSFDLFASRKVSANPRRIILYAAVGVAIAIIVGAVTNLLSSR